MQGLTPASFWLTYKEQLRTRGSWNDYQTTKKWTQTAKEAAEAACKSLGLQTCHEYFRLDVLGYEERADRKYDWTARVAFEVENTAHWKDELCKLTHIVSSLCVLVGYEWHKTWTAKEALEHYLHTLSDRIFLVPGRKWLFIFGPSCEKLFDPWIALTFDEKKQLVSVDSEPPLRGADFGGSDQET